MNAINDVGDDKDDDDDDNGDDDDNAERDPEVGCDASTSTSAPPRRRKRGKHTKSGGARQYEARLRALRSAEDQREESIGPAAESSAAAQTPMW